VVGVGWTAFTHPDDRAAAERLFAEVLAAPGGTSRPYETRLVTADGRTVEVEGTATAITFRGRPAVHSFTRDVTARRRADVERLRAQRLEALGGLAASVAHDFNNLLAVMLGALELAVEAGPDDEPLREDLRRRPPPRGAGARSPASCSPSRAASPRSRGRST
jgi:signal transduction histidine kinase